jgi:beta-glucosidase
MRSSLSTVALLAMVAGAGCSDGAARAEALLSGMSLEDKAGQMTQLDIDRVLAGDCPVRVNTTRLRMMLKSQRFGSLFNTPFTGGRRCGSMGWTAAEWRSVVTQIQAEAQKQGIPPVLFGIDSVHGANYVRGALLMPQQLGLAASFDERLATHIGTITAKDSRAAALPWLFAPILGVMSHPLWARVYETFGEDPLVAARMGAALIRGLQQPGRVSEHPRTAAACMKHFIGCARNGI